MTAATAADTAFETLLNNEPIFPENEDGLPRRLDFLGYAGCPVRAELRRRLHARLRTLAPAPAWFIPGGCHGDEPYAALWQTTDPAALPALIADTGFGDFNRPTFVKNFLSDTRTFAPQPADAIRPEFHDAGLVDPLGLHRVYGANIEVILVDKKNLGERPLPRCWEDLLHPRFRDAIVVSGSPDDLFEGLLFAFYNDFGEDGLTALGANVHAFMHPAEMAKTCGSGNPRGGAIYLLPAFFAASIPHRENSHIVWPEDGAYLSPQYFLRRHGDNPAADLVADYLCGEEWAAHLAKIGFAPARTSAPLLPGKLRWLGWDFVRTHDIEALRAPLNAAYATGVRKNWKPEK
jgi:ABC-type Fe3+ transport system substrate-binding protein